MKALIAYGTRWDSTAEVAERMGKILNGKGVEVDIVDLGREKVRDVSPYALVIVGSSIKMGRWTKQPLRFLEKNGPALVKRKVALFVCCGDANNPDKRGKATAKYLEGVAGRVPGLRPVKLGLFGGVIDVSKYGFLTRKMMMAAGEELKKDGIDVNKPNDFRDWKAIREWTEGLVG